MKKNSKPYILGVITARGGSKGIPKKNIKKLGGKPLIAYTIDTSKKSKLLTTCIVSTDDDEIADVCKMYGASVPFMRPKELANDTATHQPVLKHAVEFIEKHNNVSVDYVVILQPTSPFRTVDDLDDVIRKLIDTNADSAVSLVELTSDSHPVKAKKIIGDKVESYSIPEEEGTRRQDLPVAYRRSGAVYVMKRDLIVKEGRLYGDFVTGCIVPRERSIDIDTMFDWMRAEYMLEDLKKKGYEF